MGTCNMMQSGAPNMCARPTLDPISQSDLAMTASLLRPLRAVLLLSCLLVCAAFQCPVGSFAPSTQHSAVMLAKKTSWSVGHARKKPKKKVEKAARPAARGFGDSAAEAVSADLDAQAVPSAPAEADDAETMAAWRAYAAEAIAAVEKMEAKSDSVLDLLQAEQ